MALGPVEPTGADYNARSNDAMKSVLIEIAGAPSDGRIGCGKLDVEALYVFPITPSKPVGRRGKAFCDGMMDLPQWRHLRGGSPGIAVEYRPG